MLMVLIFLRRQVIEGYFKRLEPTSLLIWVFYPPTVHPESKFLSATSQCLFWPGHLTNLSAKDDADWSLALKDLYAIKQYMKI